MCLEGPADGNLVRVRLQAAGAAGIVGMEAVTIGAKGGAVRRLLLRNGAYTTKNTENTRTAEAMMMLPGPGAREVLAMELAMTVAALLRHQAPPLRHRSRGRSGPTTG